MPKKIAIAIKAGYDEQSGVIDTATVEITKHILLSNNELIHGKSAIQPQMTRPIVLVIPMIERRNDAELWSIP